MSDIERAKELILTKVGDMRSVYEPSGKTMRKKLFIESGSKWVDMEKVQGMGMTLTEMRMEEPYRLVEFEEDEVDDLGGKMQKMSLMQQFRSMEAVKACFREAMEVFVRKNSEELENTIGNKVSLAAVVLVMMVFRRGWWVGLETSSSMEAMWRRSVIDCRQARLNWKR